MNAKRVIFIIGTHGDVILMGEKGLSHYAGIEEH